MARKTSRATLIGALGVLAAGASVLVYVIVLALTAGPDATIESGREFLRRGLPYRAIETLDAVLDREPGNVAALICRGRAHVATGELAKARADFEAARGIETGNLAARVGLAEVLRRQGKLDEAMADARAAAEAFPASPEPMAVIGRCHYDRFQRHARECIRLVEGSAPRDALAAAAVRDVRRGRFQTTEQFLASWRDRDPAAARKSGLDEQLTLARKAFDEAIAALRAGTGQTAERPGQGDPETWLDLAALLRDCGKLEEARKTAEAARLLPDVDRVQAGIVLAEVFAALADELMTEAARTGETTPRERAAEMSDKAIRVLEELVADFPAAAEVRRRLAMQYLRANRPDDAEREARAAMRETKSDVVHYVVGIVHLTREEYDDAVTELLLAKSMIGDPRYHFFLARAYERGGENPRVSLAADEYKKVLSRRPRFVPALLSLARLRLRRGWASDAKELAERVYALPGLPPGTRVEACMLAGEANRELRRYDQVMHWMEQAHQIRPASATDAHLIDEAMEREVVRSLQGDSSRDAARVCVLGVIYRKKGQTDKAVQRFKEAILLDPQYIPAYVHLANLYVHQKNDLDAAAEQFQAAIRIVRDLAWPVNPSLHFGLAVVRIRQKRYREAREELNTVLTAKADYVPARLRLAALQLRDRQFREARANVSRAVTAGGESAEAYFIAGLIDSAIARRPDQEIEADLVRRRAADPALRGQPVTPEDIAAARRVAWEDAIQDYERAIDLDPEFHFSYEVGLIYAMRERYGPMAAAYARAVKNAPPAARPPLRRRLAVALMGLESHDKAVAEARKALDDTLGTASPNPEEVLRCRYILANCLLGKGDFAGARAEISRVGGGPPGFSAEYVRMVDHLESVFLDAAESDNPKDALALFRTVALGLSRAFLFSRGGVAWLGEAERTYRLLIPKFRNNLVALHYLAELYMVQERLDLAERTHRRILGISAQYPPSLRSLAAIAEQRTRAAAAQKDTTEEKLAAQARAIELYQQAISADKDYWLPRLELAALYARAGAADKAKELYREVIALNPRQVRALNDYAVLCAQDKEDLKQAIEHATQARKINPYSGEVADTLGVLWNILGRPNDAVRELEQARALLPNSPTVRFHLAEAYHAAGRLDPALRLLDQLLAADQPFPDRATAVRLQAQIRAEKAREQKPEG
jgi:tetratricopeptide (TPR) repeat protein